MATPMTPQTLLDVLVAEGLDVYEYPGWRDRCRCHNGSHERQEGYTGRSWGPIHGVTAHITTGGRYTGQQALDYTRAIIVGGNGSTPGPLSQAGIDGDGRVILVSAGRCNHVGSVSQRASDAMRAGAFSLDGWQDLRGSGVDGNAMTYGVEMYSPSGPTEVQVEAFVRVGAAICRHYGWDGGEVHGHGEVSDQRAYSDPGYDMGAIRRRVRDLVTVPGSGGGQSAPRPAPAPAPPPTPAPQPTPAPTAGGFMAALTDQQQQEMYYRVMYGIPGGSAEGRYNPDGSRTRVLDSGDGDYLRQLVEGLSERVARLEARP